VHTILHVEHNAGGTDCQESLKQRNSESTRLGRLRLHDGAELAMIPHQDKLPAAFSDGYEDVRLYRLSGLVDKAKAKAPAGKESGAC